MLINVLLFRVKKSFFNKNFDKIQDICLQIPIILEYLQRINAVEFVSETKKSITSKISNNYSKMTSSNCSDEYVKSTKQFLDSYSIISNDDYRGICSIGIMIGIIIKAQKEYLESKGTPPFVNKLNRLEMDMNKLISLPSEAWNRLRYYKDETENFENLFTYLTSEEIPKLNLQSNIQRNVINLLFVIGMAYGFTIYNKMRKKGVRIDKPEPMIP